MSRTSGSKDGGSDVSPHHSSVLTTAREGVTGGKGGMEESVTRLRWSWDWKP